MSDDLLVDRADGVVTLTLNRPEKSNAITGAMWGGLRDVFDEVATNRDDRVLVITGAGKGFCSGADLRRAGHAARHRRSTRAHARRRAERGRAARHRASRRSPRSTAWPRAPGCNLALGCDLVIASDVARFSAIFVQRGLSIDYGGSWLLPRLIGMHRAKELAFLADVIDAAEAERVGIVNRVVPAAELDAAVDTVVARLAPDGTDRARQTKHLLDQAFTVTFAEAVEAEAAAQVVNLELRRRQGSRARVHGEAPTRSSLASRHRRVGRERVVAITAASTGRGTAPSSRRVRARAPRRRPATA